MSPLVSILFPCYNAEKFLRHSLDSILNQDYRNLEVICVNDGSTDTTAAILSEYQEKDHRLTVITNAENKGLIESLNASFAYVKGEFFGRMDADDYCPPQRISKQLAFLNAHPEFDLVSNAYNYFIIDDRPLEYVPPIGTLPRSLQFMSLFSTPLTHASVLGRTRLIKEGLYVYDKAYQHSEDFELFSRLAWKGVRLANLEDSLYLVRLNSQSVSASFNDIQINTHLRITRRNLKERMNESDYLSETILKLISNRIDEVVSISQLKTALNLLNGYFSEADSKMKFTEEETKEIRSYLNLHSLNIIIQANKIRFMRMKFQNLGFFTASVFLLRLNHLPLIGNKLYNYFKYRCAA